MKLNAKRVFPLLLAACLFLCGCGRSAVGSHNGVTVTSSLDGAQPIVGGLPCEFPLTEDSVDLNILAAGYGGIDFEDVYVWQKYEEMTGVDVNWTTVTNSERSEAVNTALQNGRDYDLILRCKISATRLTKYGENGLILNLAEDGLLQTYAPNCWAFLQSHPTALASVTNPDGAIYSLPQVNSGAELRVSRKLFINKNWLENVGMELPTTTGEFYELLKAFKEQDANGNGDPNDEIPLCSQDWASLQESFYGAFGLGSRGQHNMTVDSDPDTGEVRFIAASEGYRDFLEYFNTLYAEGLLDKYMFTMTTEQWYNNAKNDLIGVFANTNLATLPAEVADNWVAIDEALEGPNGDKLWAAVRADFHSVGAAVIPATCDDPALALRWLDYFWTDEGTLFYHMGVEGETFVANADGSYDYSPKIYDEISTGSKSFDDVVSQYSPYPGGSNPTVETAPYFKGGEMAAVPAQAARDLFEYGPSEYWPSFTYTSEETAALDPIRADLEKYCDTMRVEFITGVSPLSRWDDYLHTIEGMGVAELLAIYQSAADRYYALQG